jgi:hypothetical protein
MNHELPKSVRYVKNGRRGKWWHAALDEYVERFSNRRDYYARMIFAVHSPAGEVVQPGNLPVQV